MTLRSFILFGSVLLALLMFFGGGAKSANKPSFTSEQLEIVTADSKLAFTVELAISPAEREHGLMERKSLADDRGMLFDFGMTRRANMWMKNTYVPLDMLFIDQKGVILAVKENALPLSEDIIDSQARVRFVLEVKAGTVQAKKIRVGDHAVSAQITSVQP